MKISFFVFLLSVISLTGAAQILNVEKDRIDKDTSNIWLGNIGFSFNSRSQQVRVLTFNASTNIAYLSRLHSYNFISNTNLIKVKGSDVISDGYAHFRITYFRKNKLTHESFMQIQYDQSRGLLQRELLGGGLRYKIHTTKEFKMAAGVGVMYEHEHWKYKDSDSTTTLLKSANYLSLHWKINKYIACHLINYYQARFDAFFHPRITTDANIVLSINKHFSLNNRFVATYDAIPVIPINKYIYSVTNGLLFKF